MYIRMLCFFSSWKNNHFKHRFREKMSFPEFQKYIFFTQEGNDEIWSWGWVRVIKLLRCELFCFFPKVILFDDNNVLWGVPQWNSVAEKPILGRRKSIVHADFPHTHLPSFPHASGGWEVSWQWEMHVGQPFTSEPERRIQIAGSTGHENNSYPPPDMKEKTSKCIYESTWWC